MSLFFFLQYLTNKLDHLTTARPLLVMSNFYDQGDILCYTHEDF